MKSGIAYLDVLVSPLGGQEGFRPTGYLAHIQDVTEAKRVEIALRESEEWFRSIYEESPIAIDLCDADGRLLEANQACLDLFGQPSFAMLSSFSLFDEPYVPDHAREKLRRGETARYDAILDYEEAKRIGLHKTAGPGLSYLHIIVTPLGLKQGTHPNGYLVQIQNITQRQRAVNALRDSEELFRSIHDDSPIPIAICDSDGRVVKVNKACEDTLGMPHVTDATPPKLFDDPNVPDHAKGRLRRGETVRYTVEVDKEVRKMRVYRRIAPEITHLDVMISPLGLKQGEPLSGYLVHMQDVTGHRRKEEALRDLSRRLVQMQEAERRHIAYELHDEIGQALTGLKFLLKMATRSDSQGIKGKLDEAEDLINDVMSRVGDLSLNLRPSMLDDLGLLPALQWHFERYTAKTGVQVILDPDRSSRRFGPEVETAAFRIVQEALTNVARHAGIGETYVKIHADDENLTIQVRDEGSGFDREASIVSASIGLVSMRERAMSLGGELTIDSAPGRGTRLTASLPLKGRFNHDNGG